MRPSQTLGNHDLILDSAFVHRFPKRLSQRQGSCRSDLRWGNVIYLQDESYTATFPNGRKLKIFGFPWTSQYGNWAFQYPRVRNVFAGKIPKDTDILLTHGPPRYHLDSIHHSGCEHLTREILRVHRTLKLVVFGHVHSGRGSELLPFDNLQKKYERILLGDYGFSAVLDVGSEVMWSWFRWMGLLPKLREKRKPQTVRLVNAAVAHRYGWYRYSTPPLVFRI